MKLSKSILSPSHGHGHGRNQPKLKPNGSIKGLQSPMFPTSSTTKKHASSFENPEPSSPKVTCIGQVKMKSRKQVKRRSDLSRQTPDSHVLNRMSSVHLQRQECVSLKNQKWVHLPLTIYQALREFGCLFPCRPWCISKEKTAEFNGSRDVNNSILARWLVVLQDGEAETTRKDDLRNSRRHVFEDIEFKGEEEKGSIPPRNALLLMRCRSDTKKMPDLNNEDAQKCEISISSSVEMEIESKDSEEKSMRSEQIPEPKEEEEKIKSTIQKEIEEMLLSEQPNQEEANPEESEVDKESIKGNSVHKTSGSREQKNKVVLPDCLLLMMYEPKLSMEVSKETWVCRTDFILPERRKKATCIKTKPTHPAQDSKSEGLPQPPRSSCSLPESMIEQKLVIARCKSEPISCLGVAEIGF